MRRRVATARRRRDTDARAAGANSRPKFCNDEADAADFGTLACRFAYFRPHAAN